jgi:hypothetical protein
MIDITGVTRWNSRLKAHVLRDISMGNMSVDQACDRYGLSIDELKEWQARAASGIKGLKATVRMVPVGGIRWG